MIPEGSDDDPGMNSLLNERLALLQKLPGQDDYTGGAVTHLGILVITSDTGTVASVRQQCCAVFRIRMDLGFFADPDPGFISPDLDPSINKLLGSK